MPFLLFDDKKGFFVEVFIKNVTKRKVKTEDILDNNRKMLKKLIEEWNN